MNFLINGDTRPLPLTPDQRFAELLHYVQQHWVNEKTVVSSIRVNGVEISEAEEKDLGPVRISDLESVELLFSSPKQVARETIDMLNIFSTQIADLSRDVANATNRHVEEEDYERLIDAIQTFSEVITTVKVVLHGGTIGPVSLLEADLLSIVKDLLDATEKGDQQYRHDLLALHLPGNMEHWKTEGIPAFASMQM